MSQKDDHRRRITRQMTRACNLRVVSDGLALAPETVRQLDRAIFAWYDDLAGLGYAEDAQRILDMLRDEMAARRVA